MNGQKLDVHKRTGPNRLERLTEDKLFLGYGQIEDNEWMEEFLKKRVPHPSPFERDRTRRSRLREQIARERQSRSLHEDSSSTTDV
jgi:hypothetical protein